MRFLFRNIQIWFNELSLAYKNMYKYLDYIWTFRNYDRHVDKYTLIKLILSKVCANTSVSFFCNREKSIATLLKMTHTYFTCIKTDNMLFEYKQLINVYLVARDQHLMNTDHHLVRVRRLRISGLWVNLIIIASPATSTSNL